MKSIFGKSARRSALASAMSLAVLMSVGVAQAADAPAQRVAVRGEITAVEADALKVHTLANEDVTVALTKDTQVRGVTLAKLADIKPGSYIGTAAMPGPDGTLTAMEVHVFPPELAGTGDGHRPFDLAQGSTMTNGRVGELKVANGRTLTLSYKGGEKKVVVPDDVPVVNLVPGDRSLLKPGVKVVLFAQQGADGKLAAAGISAGENGVKPPM
ncbi:DUF5666 domain-containing protein [Pseudomonas gingeri]